jgi:hypothetical protein
MSNTGKQKSKSLEDLVVASTSSTSVMAWKKKCTDPCRSFETVVPNLPQQNLYLLFLKLQKSDETLRNLEPKEKKAEIDKRWRELSVDEKSSFNPQARQEIFEFDLESISQEDCCSKLIDIMKRKTAKETKDVQVKESCP